MDRFPRELAFRGTWRDYQQRVLDDLDAHLEDGRLHVVAAPGSGKTTLGLEVLRRLDAPTVVLAPTVTIRDQWAGRLVGQFLPEGAERPPWLSSDLRAPGLLTVATYQALHAATTGRRGREDDADAESDEDPGEGEDAAPDQQPPVDVVAVLRERGVRTLVVDEAHHLRSEWWRVLTALAASLEGLRIVALTATPPYDVPPSEWRRYRELCGPVDTEVPVPELVARGDLCPHQDLVRVTTPSPGEGEQLAAFRADVDSFVTDLMAEGDLRAAVLAHPWVKDPRAEASSILSRVPEFTSMLVFMRASGLRVPSRHLRVLRLRSSGLPDLSLPLLEVLLRFVLEGGEGGFDPKGDLVEGLRARLRRIGAFERRTLRLTGTRRLDRMLATSVTKLDAIAEVVREEHGSWGEALRLVVLTDFIRRDDLPSGPGDEKPLKQLGVVPIFERLRRDLPEGLRPGILSGSLVVLPRAATESLRDAAEAAGIDPAKVRSVPLAADPRFERITVEGAGRQAMVRLVTSLFSRGEVTCLVGTAALLGEGWDAPSLSTLVLASYVGSYMLSNQMRGRAIRALAGSPGKTANIWHLLCAETGREDPGEDHATLLRRFRAFTGPDAREPILRNGLERLGMGPPPWSVSDLRRIAAEMERRAADREGLAARWREALDLAGPDARLVEEIRVPGELLPREGVLRAARLLLFAWGVPSAAALFGAWSLALSGTSNPVAWAALVLGGLPALVLLPATARCTWWALRHRSPAASLRRTGRTILEALHRIDMVRTDPRGIHVEAEQREGDTVDRADGWMKGGTAWERSLWVDAMAELLDPMERPRYLLERRPPFVGRWLWCDFHAVPRLLGKGRSEADILAGRWLCHVGWVEARPTRGEEGARELQAARAARGAWGPERSTERVVVWR